MSDRSQMPERVEKPWGHELIYARTDRYLGKILHVRSGCRLSLQFHRRKDETILVRGGTLLVEIEEEGRLVSKTLGPGEGCRIRPLQKHRFTARTECEILEVSTPEGDDVVRLEDDYGRALEPDP